MRVEDGGGRDVMADTVFKARVCVWGLDHVRRQTKPPSFPLLRFSVNPPKSNFLNDNQVDSVSSGPTCTQGLSGTHFVCASHRSAVIVSTTPPALFISDRGNRSYGFVIIIQNSTMDFCCKAKTYRSHTCSASLQHRRWKKHRRLFLQVKPAIQGRIGIFNVLHQRPPFSCLFSWHSSHSCHFHQIHFLLSAFLTDFPVESFCPDITLSNETKVTFSFSLSHRSGNHLRPSWLLFTGGSSPRPRWCECPTDVCRCHAIDSSFRRKWQKKTLL